MTGFCSSPRFADHLTGPHHPERPDRIRAIHRAVRLAGLVASPDPFPDFQIDLGPLPQASTPLVEIEPVAVNPSVLTLVHPQALVDRVRHIASIGGGVLDSGDTPIGPASYDIALLAVGAVVEATKAVTTGRVKRAFAAVRPPGHHAEPDRSMGFCLFANVAIAARYAQQHLGIGRIAIVDFDVHHGNGTQAAFEDDPSVLFISLHQDPRTCYPGSGYDYEFGDGPGRGTTLNIPFPPASGDDEYLAAFDAKVIPKLHDFAPDLLFISAGFDAHRDDPLAQINLSEDCYTEMTRKLTTATDELCGGRVVSALEGGYNLRALGRCAVKHLLALHQ